MRPPRIFLAVLLLALLIRGGVLWLTPGALQTDPDGYRRLAQNLVEHGTFGAGQTPTAYRPPLYPLLLTGCLACGDYSRTAIGVLHVVLGVATVGLVMALGRWWGLTARGAALAALLVACDPILLSQSTLVMTETPAALLAVAGVAALAWAGRKPSAMRAMLAGATLALGALCRPTLLLWAIVAGVANLLTNSRELTAPGKKANRLRYLAAFVLGASIVLSPWAIRNQLQFGRPIVTTTHGGYTLLLANNPEFYQWLRSGQWGSVWQANELDAAWLQRRPPDELKADRLAYAEAWQTIRDQPGTFAYSCLVRVGRFWSPLPHQVAADETPLHRLARWAVAAWYVLEFLLAAVGLRRLSPLSQAGEGPGVRAAATGHGNQRNDECRPAAPAIHHSSFCILHSLLLAACLTAVHAFFWTDMRMRGPVMPVVALAAAAALGCQRRAAVPEPV